MIFEINSWGKKTDWVLKEWAGLFFPWGKNGPAHSFPGEKTDWGKFRPVTGNWICPGRCTRDMTISSKTFSYAHNIAKLVLWIMT